MVRHHDRRKPIYFTWERCTYHYDDVFRRWINIISTYYEYIDCKDAVWQSHQKLFVYSNPIWYYLWFYRRMNNDVFFTTCTSYFLFSYYFNIKIMQIDLFFSFHLDHRLWQSEKKKPEERKRVHGVERKFIHSIFIYFFFISHSLLSLRLFWLQILCCVNWYILTHSMLL